MNKQYILHYDNNNLFKELTEPIENRIKYIKENKPTNVCLRVMRILTDEEVEAIPREAREVLVAAENAWEALRKEMQVDVKNQEIWETAWEKARGLRKIWDEAIDKWVKIQSSSEIIQWHKRICKPDCLWNGHPFKWFILNPEY